MACGRAWAPARSHVSAQMMREREEKCALSRQDRTKTKISMTMSIIRYAESYGSLEAGNCELRASAPEK